MSEGHSYKMGGATSIPGQKWVEEGKMGLLTEKRKKSSLSKGGKKKGSADMKESAWNHLSRKEGGNS